MLRDEAVTIEAETGWNDDGATDGWKTLHRDLKRIAKKRCALDADEARLLVKADRTQLWRHVGCITLVEYMERELGHSPRAALERIRVAQALMELPQLRDELARGEWSYSAVRELTRKLTPESEAEWLDKARGKTIGEIERMVANHQRGDRPDDPTTPDADPKSTRFDLTDEVRALVRRTRAVLETEVGQRLSDDELFGVLCRRAVEAPFSSKRPAHQITTTVCAECMRGWQDGVELSPGALACVMCDHDDLGPANAERPGRVVPRISPRMRRHVLARDQQRCRAPGCRSLRNLDVHHIVPRARGGKNVGSNLLTLCSGHHRVHHDGILLITGRAPDRLEFAWRDGSESTRPGTHSESGSSSKLDAAVRKYRDTPRSKTTQPSTSCALRTKSERPTTSFSKLDAAIRKHRERERPMRSNTQLGTQTASCARRSSKLDAATKPDRTHTQLGRKTLSPLDAPSRAIDADARSALETSGFKAPEARRAVEVARERLGGEHDPRTAATSGISSLPSRRELERN